MKITLFSGQRRNPSDTALVYENELWSGKDVEGDEAISASTIQDLYHIEVGSVVPADQLPVEQSPFTPEEGEPWTAIPLHVDGADSQTEIRIPCTIAHAAELIATEVRRFAVKIGEPDTSVEFL